MKSFKELKVWNKSIKLCVGAYKATESFPKSEIYGLVGQIRRSAVAIPSNIAEGQKRAHKKEYIQFLRVAYGAGAELETQLLIAQKVGYLRQKDYDELSGTLEEIMKMLNRLISVLTKTYKL